MNIFLGKPPAGVEAWMKAHYQPAGHPETRVKYVGGATDTFNIEGILNSSSIANISIVEEVDIGNTVESIGNSAFSGCSSLTSVTIPDSVTSIEVNAFSDCSSLTSVTIPDSVSSIKDWTFGNCTALESVTVGNGVTSIKLNAFRECRGLTSVTIPNGVTSIERDAFYYCTSVTDVYCWPNPANLEWNDYACDDFKEDGSTVCHVRAEYLAAYQSKFTGIVNVTFVGDLA